MARVPKSFGQAEKLTNRIRRLLQGYTCDVSIFKEFIQNADDAGATEIRFIKDFRRLGTDSVPDGWQELQGPALCVYNNADFTSRDIEGIQNLGEGSKGEEMTKTGQFGVGFNAVYHITDVPSFWTRRDGQEQVICVCDPCRLIPSEWPEPGMELEDIESLKEEYPDLLDGYLCNVFDVSQPGTLFRLPLRTKWMAGKSAIHKEPMTENKVSQLLTDFMKDANICLLFLNNLRKIGIYSTKDGTTLEKEYEVEMVMDEANTLKKEVLYRFLKEESENLMSDSLNFDIRHLAYPEIVLKFHVKDTQGVQEDWIQVSRAGFLKPSDVPEILQEDWRNEHFRLLPSGGVAVKIHRSEALSAVSSNDLFGTNSFGFTKREKSQSRVFCSLPLPLETDLPVHINGHFALEHESRRSLWDRKGDSRTAWNRLVCTKVIAPAYVKAIEQVKSEWFGQKQKEMSAETALKLNNFFALFPTIPTESKIWSLMVEAFYQQLISGRHALFPVTRASSTNITWTSVWKDKAFVAFFIRPLAYVCLASTLSNSPQQEFSLGSAPSSEFSQPRLNPQITYYEETARDQHLVELLKRLNMKIVDAPHHVFAALKQYGADKMQEATSSNVLVFLKSGTSSTSDSCSLKNLPQPLSRFELSEDDILCLTKFVRKSPSFPSEISGLPLCLLQSGTLDIFSHKRQPFVTSYCDLLPTLSEEFLHRSLVEVFRSVVKNASNILRTFEIKDLAERLSVSLSAKHFRTGWPCAVKTSSLPHDMWLQNLWAFLRNRLELAGQNTDLRKALSCLNGWSLVPCKTTRQDERLLYPIQESGKILFLPSAVLQRPTLSPTCRVAHVLQKLSLPILEDSIVSQSLAKKFVASLDKPESIMSILTSFKGNITLSQNDATCLLDYFAQYVANAEPKQWSGLWEIPMFCTIDGRIITLEQQDVLVLPKDIPRAGLEVWSQVTGTALLNSDLIPKAIFQIMDLKKLSNMNRVDPFTSCSLFWLGGDKTSQAYGLFWERLMSTIRNLPQNAADTHILFFRNACEIHGGLHQHDTSCRILSETAFIRVGPNRMCKPSEFYSPHNAVFKELCDASQFPPEPYCQPDWRDFMERVGMVTHVTDGMFISFAKQVETEGNTALSTKTLTQLSTLVNHLFHRQLLSLSDLLEKVRDLRFARPWSFAAVAHKTTLAKICPPFVVNRLVSFSECCHPRHWPLLWSTAAILHPDDVPSKHVNLYNQENILEKLSFEKNVPVEKFKQHVANVCQALHTSSRDLLDSSQGRKDLEWLFHQFYEFMANLKPEVTEYFQNIPVVFDSYSGRLLYPDQVVITLRWDDAVDGWLFRAPTNYDKYFGLLQSLGVAASVTADHYARVLNRIRLEQERKPLDGDMLTACKKAVEGLFHRLQASDQLTQQTLYLPDEQYRLKPSTLLIVNDNDSLRRRLHHCSDKFLADLRQLSFHSASPWDLVSILPKRNTVARLSQIATEEIPPLVLSIRHAGPRAHDFKKKLSSAEFVNGITRLVYHKHVTKTTPMAGNSHQRISCQLQRIEVFETEKLHTVLNLNGRQMAGSESYHGILRDEKRPHCAFVDSNATFHDEEVVTTLADVIAEAVEEDLSEFRSVLSVILRCPDVNALLDQLSISCLPQTETFISGSYMSTHDVCLLENCVTSLYVTGENVALELYDALIDNEELESDEHQTSTHRRSSKRHKADDMYQSLQNPPISAEVISNQVVIYARVIERLVVGERQNAYHPCCMSYRVDIGYGRNMDVSAIRLHKIPAASVDDNCKSLSTTAYCASSCFDSVRDDTVVNDVRKCLEVSLPILGDKRLQLGLLKRLCLQWHPDLSPKTRAVCQKIVEEIKQFTFAFNRSLSLDHPKKNLATIPVLNPLHQPVATAEFFAQVHSRGRLIDATRTGTSDLDNRPQGKNPQPGEARRWLRHAVADWKTAKSSLGDSYWHCFLCHQAAEKALKAVLLYKDANDKLLSPAHNASLTILASAIGNERLKEVVEALERLTGEKWRMFPFVQWAPQIPAIAYTVGIAESAWSQVEIILSIAASLMT